ncbi:MAG TPA: C-terminal binding protein [Candidatus Limnocylindrales bacterium]|nr:C-terminal binding protein [Candidatus Limnocylindrales bacterium]
MSLVLLSQRLGAVTAAEERLRETGAEVRGAPLWSLAEIREHGAEARLIILGAVEPFDAAALESLPVLEAIVRRGVGTDNVDLEAATRLGIVVANVPDASVEEVSDHALALLLTIERQVVGLDHGVRSGVWSRDPSAIQALRRPIRRLQSLTLGVIGLGRIGRALVRKAEPIYGRVIGSDPFVKAASGVSVVPFDELIATADHLSVHAPLTAETRDLIDGAAIGRMQPGSVLVNTSRGGLVDEAAVIDAVRRGHLLGAGLDVTAQEPLPPDAALLEDPRILLTAHSAASSSMADRDLVERSVDAAGAILSGRMPASIANPSVLGSSALRARSLAEVQQA